METSTMKPRGESTTQFHGEEAPRRKCILGKLVQLIIKLAPPRGEAVADNFPCIIITRGEEFE